MIQWPLVAAFITVEASLIGAFGAGFAVGRSRGKTEAYADMHAKKKKA
jgi:hypothetical protein